MNILVVNDDGIEEKAIHILAKALQKYGSVAICAPNQVRSASSHGIIITKDLKIEKYQKSDIEAYITDGMPADCVRLGTTILNKEFDIVFSGINNGLNLGTDIIYSGTVAAAREANIEGIPSVAISMDKDSYEIVNHELEIVLDFIFSKKLYSLDYTLNINFPTKDFKESKGICFAKQGIKRFKTYFKKTGSNTYMEDYSDISYDTKTNTDVYLAEKGFITIVPLMVDQTNIDALNRILKTIKE